MENSKYSKVLTIILIISILAIIGLLIYVGIDWYKAYTTEIEASDAVDQFNSLISGNMVQNEELNNNIVPTENVTGPNTVIENTVNNNNTTGGNSSSGGNTGSSTGGKMKLGGYNVIGRIEIPKTKVDYLIVDAYTPKALELAICKQYGPGINEIGNTVLIGHNFRNGTFFSNNSKLSNGDKIYITDVTGKKVTYVIKKTYTTSTSDYTYANRDTQGKRGISLSTCTNDTQARLIIWADEV